MSNSTSTAAVLHGYQLCAATKLYHWLCPVTIGWTSATTFAQSDAYAICLDQVCRVCFLRREVEKAVICESSNWTSADGDCSR